MATINDVFDALPRLRNGDVAQYRVVHIAAGIPAMYNYFEIGPIAEITDVMRFIKVEAAIYAQQFEADGVSTAEARKRGVVLAAVRIGMRKSWQLENADIIRAQRHDAAWYTARHRIADPMTTDDEIEIALPNEPVRNHYTAIAADNDLCEPSTIAKLLRLGMAAPVVTGVILVKTDGLHHFVEPHKNVFRVVMKQVLGSVDNIPFGMSQDDFEDIVAHKAAHVVNTGTLIQFARDPATRAKLMAAGLASAAVRCPAMYGPESAMSAVESLVMKVRDIGRAANIAIDIDSFRADRNAVFDGLDLDTPDGRSEATVRATEFTADHGVDIARCVGVVRATCENANIPAPPLLRSYALRRVVNDNTAAASEGAQQMLTFFRVQRERARRGILGGMALFGAAVPPETAPLPADETLNQVLMAVLGNGGAQRGNTGAAGNGGTQAQARQGN